MPVGYRVQVYYRELNRATVGRGGAGGMWARRLAVSMISEARAEAPVRDGKLKAGHRINRERGSNQWMVRYRIENIAAHAEWVHEGTTGPIVRGDGGKMVLPPYGGYGKVVTRSVSGQSANPWLDRACSRVSMRYGAVPTSL